MEASKVANAIEFLQKFDQNSMESLDIDSAKSLHKFMVDNSGDFVKVLGVVKFNQQLALMKSA